MTLRDDIRQELRHAGLLHVPDAPLPPPTDTEAERQLVSMALDGQVKPSEFPELLGRHFYSPLHAYAWVACDAVWGAGVADPRNLVAPVVAAMEADGFRHRDLAGELEQLRDEMPWCHRDRLGDMAARVVAAAEARLLLDVLQRAQAALRTGHNVGAVKRRLAEVCGG